MKILYLDQTGKLGGGEIALLPWLDHAREGAKVLLFEDGPFRSAIEALGIPVEVLGNSGLSKVRRESGLQSALSAVPALWRLRAQVAEQARDFDLVYANSQKAFLVGALATRGKEPLVWHLRDIMTADHFSSAMRRVAVFMGNRYASAVLCNSHATAESFIAAGGDRTKVRVVHDGVSPAPFDEVAPQTAMKLRADIAPENSTLVGLFGRLSPWKGQDVLLEALSSLPHVHCAFVGDALFGEQAYVETLKARAAKPDLAGRVHFLGFRNDVPALMKAVDIVVHASTSPEPFGLVIVEGMLARKPVIATAAGGAKEIVEDRVSGWLVKPGSVPEMRDALQTLAADLALRKILATAGRQRAETAFSAEAMIAATSAAIERFSK